MPSRALSVVWAAHLLATGAAAQQLSAADRAHAVARLWSEARYNFAYWDRVRADWDSALTATLAAVGPRQTDVAFGQRLARMAALLGEGRTGVRPAPATLSRLARPPIVVRAVEGRPFIIDYAENDEMRVARPERNAEIVAVQGVPAADWIRDSILPETPGSSTEDRWRRAVERMLEGPKGTALLLQLRLPGGAIRGASVTRSVARSERWPLGRPAVEVETLPGPTLWIRLNSFEDPDIEKEIDRIFDRFANAAAAIVDVRDSEDGASETAFAVLARLSSKPFVTPRRRSPLHMPSPPPGNPTAWHEFPPDTVPPLRRSGGPAFTGPLVVLTSARTAGAAEDFVAAVRNAQRGVMFGETTAGTSGRLVVIPLPRGWSFQVCVTRNAFPDGTEYGGIGIAPEQPVAVTVPDLLAGRDAALERARAFLARP